VRLGKKYSPEVAAEAMDRTLEVLDAVSMMDRAASRVCFLESPVGGRGGIKSTVVQAFTSGVVQACLIKTGWTVHLIHPSTWKAWLTGRGNVGKPEILRAMKGRFPKDVQAAQNDGDLVDAAALARYGYEAIGRGTRLAQVRSVSNR
jgi:Holliday junction resolvasome RuvABC endonuclease subunit